MESNYVDMSRQAPPLSEHADPTEDLSRYSYSVAQVVEAFFAEGISVSERSVQRYCDSGKLKAIKINPDTREPANDGYYVYIVDPDSIPDRIAQLREKQDFAHPTVSSSVADMTRQDGARPDMPRHDVTGQENDPLPSPSTVEDLHDRIGDLEQEKRSLEIDKAARDKIVEFLQEDRKKVFEQLNESSKLVADQGKQIGRLEERLQTLIEAPKGEGDNPTERKADADVE